MKIMERVLGKGMRGEITKINDAMQEKVQIVQFLLYGVCEKNA